MSDWNPLGLEAAGPLGPEPAGRTEHVLIQRVLRRVLAFTRLSIDDVVNDPIAKNHVLGYYKLHKAVQRSSEITELERQWNPLGRRSF